MKNDVETQADIFGPGTRCWFYPAAAPLPVECVVKAKKYVDETHKYIYIIQLVSEEGREEIRYNVGATALSIDQPPHRVFTKQEEVLGEKRDRAVSGNPFNGDEAPLAASNPHTHPKSLSPYQALQQIKVEDSQHRIREHQGGDLRPMPRLDGPVQRTMGTCEECRDPFPIPTCCQECRERRRNRGLYDGTYNRSEQPRVDQYEEESCSPPPLRRRRQESQTLVPRLIRLPLQQRHLHEEELCYDQLHLQTSDQPHRRDSGSTDAHVQ